MTSDRVRIRDVAERAGVSAATVSRVLNKTPSVDPALVTKVTRAVRDLGYRPNRVARNLRRRAGTIIALVVSDIENPFFTSVARSVENVALEAGYSVILCNTDESSEREQQYLEVALAEQAAGVILAPASERTDVRAILDSGVPVVLVDRRIRGVDVDLVVVDNRSGARDAVKHLLSVGYRRVACITGPASSSTASERLRGYEEALSEAAQPVDPAYVRCSDFRVGGGYAAARELLELPEPPDAFFVANNLMSAGALRALSERGIAIPDQVGVACFDDSPWAPLMAPPLTTVVQPTRELGAEAARLVLRRLADGGGRNGSAGTAGSGSSGSSGSPAGSGRSGSPRRPAGTVVTLPTTLCLRESSTGPRPAGGRQSPGAGRQPSR